MGEQSVRQNKNRSLLFLFGKFLLTGLLIALVVDRILDLPELKDGSFFQKITHVQFSFLGYASLALLVSMILGATQWWILMRKQMIDISLKRSMRFFFVGLFFNQFMPGNVGGDIKKIYDVNRGTGNLGGSFTATLFDRLFGLFMLNACSLGVGVLFFRYDPELKAFLLPSLLIFTGFLFFFSTLFSRRFGQFIVGILLAIKLFSIAEKAKRVRERFHLYRKWSLWGQILGISAVTQFLRVSVHYFVALSLGIDLPISFFLYFVPMIAVVTALPISIGGFGVREYTAQTLFVKAGMGQLDAVVVQLLAWGINLFISLFGGILFLFNSRVRESK